MHDHDLHERGTRRLLADLGRAPEQAAPGGPRPTTADPPAVPARIRRWWSSDQPIRFVGVCAPERLRAVAPTLALSLLSVFVPACGESKMTLDGTMKGNLDGSFRIDGPIQIQMRGPTIRYEGVYVSDKLLERVDTGKTTTDWLVAVMGEPTQRARLNDGSEVWKWAYTPLEQEASLISMFGGTKDEPRLQPSTAFVRIKDGVVIEKWRD